jgi:glyoxylase-like metal-dependent hydrolase (beta-lactamase superfamily II)
MMTATKWEPELPADRVNDHIWTSAGTTDSHLVTTDDGDVVINTGFHYQGPRHRQRYEAALGRPLNVRKIVLTQSYPEQVGGWSAFAGPGVETIAHAYFPEGRIDRRLLPDFFKPRSEQVVAGRVVGGQNHAAVYGHPVEPEVDTLFLDSHAFELGGRRFELFSIPGGEAFDGAAVWLPDSGAVFIGNLDGALYGQIPALYTPRGSRVRPARLFLSSMQRVLDLEPEILVTGHDEAIVGAERIRTDMRKVMDAVRYIHDRTVEGMNAGKDLWTLMSEIRLPVELEPPPGRGPVWWYVRAVWEEYTGWFRFESVTELYPVPPKAIWGELAELAGGLDALASRATRHVAAGEALKALHFTDIALSVDPQHRPSMEARRAALELLLDRAGNNFDELHYLEMQLESTVARLGEAVASSS